MTNQNISISQQFHLAQLQAAQALFTQQSAQLQQQSQAAQIAQMQGLQASTGLTVGTSGQVWIGPVVGGTTTTLVSGDTLPSFAKPDPKQPDTLGWRAWLWSEAEQRLMSPHQNTPWRADTLIVPEWDEGDAVRGVSGIHARLVPKNWRIIGWPDGDGSGALAENPMLVTGVVERFGRYVLGTLGWRAEHVIIKELMAPSTEIGLAIEKAYPDVVVHYPDQTEGEEPCKSVKSSELGKGSRPAPLSLLSSLPTPSVVPSPTLSRLMLPEDLGLSPSSPSSPPQSRVQAFTGNVSWVVPGPAGTVLIQNGGNDLRWKTVAFPKQNWREAIVPLAVVAACIAAGCLGYWIGS